MHTKNPQTDAQRPDCAKEGVKEVPQKWPGRPVSMPEPTHHPLDANNPRYSGQTTLVVGKQSASRNDNSYTGASACLRVVVLLCLNNIYPDGDTVLQCLELLAETTCSATKLRRKALRSHTMKQAEEKEQKELFEPARDQNVYKLNTNKNQTCKHCLHQPARNTGFSS